MKIGELSAALGVSRDALRFYEKQGLLTSTRGANGYRYYAPNAVAWLTYVGQAQALGFTLAEIRQDLALLGGGPDAEAQVQQALRAKVEEVEHRIKVLDDLRSSLLLRLADPAACALTENLRRTRAREQTARRPVRTTRQTL